MKNIRYIIIGVLFLQACAGGTYYHLDADDRLKQQGYHANEANRLINTNAKNRSSNQKASEKYRQQANENAKAQSKVKSGIKYDRSFKFY